MQGKLSYLRCEVVEEEVEMSFDELCRACNADAALLRQLMEQGVLEARHVPTHGHGETATRFVGASLRRARVALHLVRDLELNAPGAALAVELLEEIARLQRELRSNRAPRGAG